MNKIVFKTCTLLEYRKIKNPPSNIVYYINNVKGKNVFFKGSVRYNNAVAISDDSLLPKLGDSNFSTNTFYFNYNTGAVYLYNNPENCIMVQNSWKDSPFDNFTYDVTMDIMKSYHNNNPTGSNIDTSKFITNEKFENTINNYYTKEIIDSNYFNKDEVNEIINKLDMSSYATIELINQKLSEYYNQNQIDSTIDNLASKIELNENYNSLKTLIDNNASNIEALKNELDNIDSINIEKSEIENYYNNIKSNFYNNLRTGG